MSFQYIDHLRGLTSNRTNVSYYHVDRDGRAVCRCVMEAADPVERETVDWPIDEMDQSTPLRQVIAKIVSLKCMITFIGRPFDPAWFHWRVSWGGISDGGGLTWEQITRRSMGGEELVADMVLRSFYQVAVRVSEADRQEPIFRGSDIVSRLRTEVLGES